MRKKILLSCIIWGVGKMKAVDIFPRGVRVHMKCLGFTSSVEVMRGLLQFGFNCRMLASVLCLLKQNFNFSPLQPSCFSLFIARGICGRTSGLTATPGHERIQVSVQKEHLSTFAFLFFFPGRVRARYVFLGFFKTHYLKKQQHSSIFACVEYCLSCHSLTAE